MLLKHQLITIKPHAGFLHIAIKTHDGKNWIDLQPIENNPTGQITATRIQEAILSGLIQPKSIRESIGEPPFIENQTINQIGERKS